MGTRSRVAVMHGDVFKSVYCHYDGYLEHTGKILNDFWGSVEANELIARGDNSGVQRQISDMNFYSDRGEEDVGYQVAHSFEEFLEQVNNCFGEYYYVMRDGVWYAGAVYETLGVLKNKLVTLESALDELALVYDE